MPALLMECVPILCICQAVLLQHECPDQFEVPSLFASTQVSSCHFINAML